MEDILKRLEEIKNQKLDNKERLRQITECINKFKIKFNSNLSKNDLLFLQNLIETFKSIYAEINYISFIDGFKLGIEIGKGSQKETG